MTLTNLTTSEASRQLASGQLTLIDVREADEFAREHIPGAISIPLSSLSNSISRLPRDTTPVFMCRSGNRTNTHCDQLQSLAPDGFILEGGLDAWRSEGLPTKINRQAPLEMMRQVQITAGSLVLLGVFLGTFVHPGFYGLSAFIGAGLTFAGASGWCGMAKLLAFLPWNAPLRA